MKKYVYIVNMEVRNWFESNPREAYTVRVTRTLERAINVMETLTGCRYNAHRIADDLRRGYQANSKFLPITPIHDDSIPEDYRYYYIERVELA